MNILVCLKQTFDTEEKIYIQHGKISEEGVNFVMNPYDEYAVEEALQIKEQSGGDVTVVTIGPDRVESPLRTALAMGADRAIHIYDDSLFEDEWTIAKVLAAAARKGAYDIILTGYMAVDDGSAQVGPRLAEELGIPHVSAVTKLAIENDKATVEKDMEGDTLVIESSLPLLITAQQGLNEPRYPSLPGIMKAKKKPLEKWNAQDLSINAEHISARTVIKDQFLPSPKKAGRILEGDVHEQVKQLVSILRSDEKII